MNSLIPFGLKFEDSPASFPNEAIPVYDEVEEVSFVDVSGGRKIRVIDLPISLSTATTTKEGAEKSDQDGPSKLVLMSTATSTAQKAEKSDRDYTEKNSMEAVLLSTSTISEARGEKTDADK